MFFCEFPVNPRLHAPYSSVRPHRKPLCADPLSPTETAAISSHGIPQWPLRRGAEAGDEREYAARSIDQFLKEWIGAGMRPPRVTKASQLVWFTGMIGA